MILEPDSAGRRLIIYFFYDRGGVVDDYVIHMLRHLQPCAADILVVCNGKLSIESRSRLAALEGVEVLVRENTGFDVWAYKTALEHCGWEAIVQYDEVVLMNFTIMGPVNSLEEMFHEMNTRDLDFWGITVHNGAPFDPWGVMPDNRIPLHLQSHFIAVRRSLAGATEFRRYWDTMGPINTYIDAVSKHEALFTERFERMGFRWEAYVDTADMVGRLFYPMFNEPVELIENRHCPVFKRKSFFAGAGASLEENSGRPPGELFEYLRSSGRYPEQLLIQHLLRSENQFDLDSSMNLTHVLPTDRPPSTEAKLRTVVVAEVDAVDRLRRILGLIEGTGADLLVVARSSSGSDEACKAVVAARSASAQVVTGDSWLEVADRLEGYDLVAVLGSDDDGATFPFSNADALSRDQREWTLASPNHLLAVAALFEERPYLGFLSPTLPLHSGYFGALGHEWDESIELVREWCEALSLPIGESLQVSKPPIAPATNAFWFRREALAPLLAAIAERTIDLTTPPTAGDARRHVIALRHLLPLAVQSSGYLPLRTITSDGAARHIGTTTHYLRELNGRLGRGRGESFSQLAHRLQLTAQVTAALPGVADAVYTVYWNYSAGFEEASSQRRTYETSPFGQRDVVARFNVPKGVDGVRFDPIEGVACICRGLRVESNARVRIAPSNGVSLDGWHFFATTDPQYVISGDVANATWIKITFAEFYLLDTSLPVLDELLRLLDGSAHRSKRGQAWLRATARRIQSIVSRQPSGGQPQVSAQRD